LAVAEKTDNPEVQARKTAFERAGGEDVYMGAPVDYWTAQHGGMPPVPLDPATGPMRTDPGAQSPLGESGHPEEARSLVADPQTGKTQVMTASELAEKRREELKAGATGTRAIALQSDLGIPPAGPNLPALEEGGKVAVEPPKETSSKASDKK
jgi:hypothetical protein